MSTRMYVSFKADGPCLCILAHTSLTVITGIWAVYSIIASMSIKNAWYMELSRLTGLHDFDAKTVRLGKVWTHLSGFGA